MKDFLRELWSRRPGAFWLALVMLAFVIGYMLRGGNPETERSTGVGLATVEQAEPEEQLVYVCPMMCVPAMEEAGECPICGMDLVPASSGDERAGKGPPRLKLSPEAVKLAEIQTVPVERKFVSAEVRLFGQVEYDPVHMSRITAFMPGVVDRVYVKRAGQFVRWGDPLFDIYSSDLLSTQQELLLAMKYVPSFLAFQKSTPHVAREAPVQARKGAKDPGRRSPEEQAALEKITAIRHKLSILGMPKRDIDEFMKVGEATGLATVYAPMYGQVIEQNAFEGTYVNTGTRIFTIGDPKYVWAKLDAYETDYPWLRRDQQVSFQTDAYPGETFHGKVVYIDPVFNVKTRTFDIGVISPGQGGRLKAGMLVRAVIHAQLTADGKVVNVRTKEDRAPLVIPASAPLITGKRAVVYVAVPEEHGLFEGREVMLGPKAREHYLVLGGLKEGEQVVVNGNFKIDSAVQISAKSSMMDIPGGHPATAHHYHGGSEVMNESYQSERMKGRMQSAYEREGPEHGRASPTMRPDVSPSEDQARSRDTIRRRKPGMYGDSTRRRRKPPGQ